MNSMIVLCALLGLTAATAPVATVLDGGYGWGAPLALGHGVATSYSSHISHPASYHGGALLGAPLVRSYAHAAPLAINHGVRIAAPAVLSHGYGVPSGLSYGVAGPSVISHGSVVRSYSAPIAIGHGAPLAIGHGAPLALGKVW